MINNDYNNNESDVIGKELVAILAISLFLAVGIVLTTFSLLA